MYIGSIALTILMYIFFAGSGCSMNQAAITINVLFFLAVSVISIHPTVQEYNSQAGLAQSAMVAIYCTYLTMSAVSMEPDDKQCNPLLRARGTRTASIVLGAIVTFLTIAYTTTRAASQGVGPLSKGTSTPNNGGYSSISDGGEHGLVTTEPSRSQRSQMRAQALRRAVDDGSLPASALDEEDSDDEDETRRGNDDEKSGAQYSYTGFHIIFFLATAWTATLLTMSLEPSNADEERFQPVGRTYAASWVKIVSAWVCYALYAWTLVAPVVLPERF